MRNGAGRTQLVSAGVAEEAIDAFRNDLLRSERTSIDAFIESRSEDYDYIGRLAIASQMLRREDESRLRPKNDWCPLFFDAVLGSGPEQFARNKAKVITFNFERSFERRLFLALRANYQVPKDELYALASGAAPGSADRLALRAHGHLPVRSRRELGRLSRA